MTLSEYLAESGHGELTRLQSETKLAYSTIHALAKGKGGRMPDIRMSTALKIEAATGGRVTVADLAESIAAAAPAEATS